MLFSCLCCARREGMGGGGRIVALLRPRLGTVPQELVEKFLRLVRRDAFMPAGRPAAIILPFVDPVPDIEAGGEGADIELGIGLDAAPPSPACAHGQLARARKVAISAVSRDRRIMAVAQAAASRSSATRLQGLALRRQPDRAPASGQDRRASASRSAPDRRRRKAPPHRNASAPGAARIRLRGASAAKPSRSIRKAAWQTRCGRRGEPRQAPPSARPLAPARRAPRPERHRCR